MRGVGEEDRGEGGWGILCLSNMRDLSFSEGGDGHKHYTHMCQDLGGFSYS